MLVEVQVQQQQQQQQSTTLPAALLERLNRNSWFDTERLWKSHKALYFSYILVISMLLSVSIVLFSSQFRLQSGHFIHYQEQSNSLPPAQSLAFQARRDIRIAN